MTTDNTSMKFEISVPNKVFLALASMPSKTRIEVTSTITREMNDVLKILGAAMDRKIPSSIPEEQRKTIVLKVAAALSTKLADVIVAELQAEPNILADMGKTAEKAHEIARGFGEFSEEELNSISSKEIRAAIAEVTGTKAHDGASFASRTKPRVPASPPDPSTSFASRATSTSTGFGGK